MNNWLENIVKSLEEELENSKTDFENLEILYKNSSCKCHRDQVREDFTNEGRGHPPKNLKFFILVFSKIKEELNKERTKPKANKKTTSIQEWAPINISLYSFFCINL